MTDEEPMLLWEWFVYSGILGIEIYGLSQYGVPFELMVGGGDASEHCQWSRRAGTPPQSVRPVQCQISLRLRSKT